MIMCYELRQAAMQCANQPVRDRLFDTANALQIAIKVFGISPTEDNLIAVNGLWAVGQKLLKAFDEDTPDPSNGGRLKITAASEDEDTQLREAA